MKIIRSIPFFLYVLILYNGCTFLTLDPTTGKTVLDAVLWQFPLISGAVISLDANTLILIIGLHAMYFELLKSTRTTVSSVINHTLSMVVFIIFLVEFIVVKAMGTPMFLVLTAMSLFTVIAGFTVSLASARRDITFER